MNSFDFNYLGKCQYPITAPVSIMETEIDCGENAIARVWWADDESDAILVCAKHLEEIQQEW